MPLVIGVVVFAVSVTTAGVALEMVTVVGVARSKKRQQIMEAVSMAFWIAVFLVAIALSYFFTTLFLERRA